MAAPPPTALPVELLEEIFLRLPPDEPACLVRASLASKPWLGLLMGPRFRTRYRNFHGAPPMLGFIYSRPPYSIPDEEKDDLPRFVATSKFGVRVPGVEDWGLSFAKKEDWGLYDLYRKGYAAWDCRHGRVLFGNNNLVMPMPSLVVWDPMTGRRRLLQAPGDYDSSRAAVFCNVAGCDHRACHEGPFQVVFVGLENDDGGCVAYAHISLPEVGKWSKPCSLGFPTEDDFVDFDGTPVFSQDALYFRISHILGGDHDDNPDDIVGIKYDLSSNCLSLIHAPPVDTGFFSETIFMAMEDGSLGFAYADGLTLNLCSRHMGSSGVVSWTQLRVVNLDTLLPIRNRKERVRVIGSIEGRDVIFLATDHGIYEINLKSLQLKKIWKAEKYSALFPYMSFNNPPERVSPSDAPLTTHG